MELHASKTLAILSLSAAERTATAEIYFNNHAIRPQWDPRNPMGGTSAAVGCKLNHVPMVHFMSFW